MIDFSCTYKNFYENIVADDITITSDNVETSTTSEGQFKFALTQYTDSSFTDLVDSDDEIKLGNNVFFLLAMENPIPNLTYALTGK